MSTRLLTVKEVEMLNKRGDAMRRRLSPERVQRLEDLLQRFVNYFNDAPSERCAWGPLVREAEDELES